MPPAKKIIHPVTTGQPTSSEWGGRRNPESRQEAAVFRPGFNGVREIATGVWRCSVALIILGSATAAYWHAALGRPMIFRGQAVNYGVDNADALPPKMKTPATEENTRESFRTGIFPAAAAVLPERVLIAVPFSPQTPLGNRSQPFKDGCEEASVMMAVYWARGEKLDPEIAKREILNQAAFEEYHFGYHRDTSLKETIKIFTDYYRYSNVELIYDIGIEDIRREIAGGNVVIVPAAGQLLNNPYFRDPPPRYHMLVIRGYDDTAEQFITNDPGTDYGENFRYSYELLNQAIHDWVEPDADITSGPKSMIVVHPPTSTNNAIPKI